MKWVKLYLVRNCLDIPKLIDVDSEAVAGHTQWGDACSVSVCPWGPVDVVAVAV